MLLQQIFEAKCLRTKHEKRFICFLWTEKEKILILKSLPWEVPLNNTRYNFSSSKKKIIPQRFHGEMWANSQMTTGLLTFIKKYI